MPEYRGIHYDFKIETRFGTVYIVDPTRIIGDYMETMTPNSVVLKLKESSENICERCATEITMEGCNCEH